MPCNECSDHKRCVPGTMRYKEQANMEYEEKAVVQVDDKGELLKCAKEYGTSDCGFKAGTKVWGNWGAMPTAVKMVPLDEDVDEEKAMLKQPPMIPAVDRPFLRAFPVDFSDKELTEFFEQFTMDQMNKVLDFFNSMPKLRHVISVTNPKTKVKSEVILEGLNTFLG